ncbi:MAG: VOC family protein [Nitrososphaerota archaeon]|nr:VOC family protein [Nitrososphaerota archaeon]
MEVRSLPKFIYTGIHVTNLEKSIRFYTKELGMKLLFKTKIKETGGKVAWLKSPRSKQLLELNWYPRNYKHGGRSGLDHLCFEVDDTHKYFEKLSRRYEAPIRPFLEGRWVLAYVKDPDGNWIELGHRTKKR